MQLIDERILTPIATGSRTVRGHASRGVDRRDIDRFLAKFDEHVPAVTKPDENLVNIAKAAEKSRTRGVEIVHLVLAGALCNAFRIEGEAGLGSLRVDVVELKCFLADLNAKGLTTSSTFKKLRVPVDTGWALTEDSHAGLCVERVDFGTDHSYPLVSKNVADEFAQNYSSLPEFAETLDIRYPELSRELSAAGIRPVFAWKKFGADIYRRLDLQEFRPA